MKLKVIIGLISLLAGGLGGWFMRPQPQPAPSLTAEEVREIVIAAMQDAPKPQLTATFQSMDWGQIKKLRRVNLTFAPQLHAENLIFDAAKAEAIRSRSLPDSQDYVIHLYPDEE